MAITTAQILAWCERCQAIIEFTPGLVKITVTMNGIRYESTGPNFTDAVKSAINRQTSMIEELTDKIGGLDPN